MSDKVIDYQSVSYSIFHGFFRSQKPLINSISLSITRGQVFGLVGPNGAGKTTFIKLGTGLIEPQKGNISIKGKPASSPEAKSSFGLLTERQYCYPDMTLNEWLLFLAGLSGEDKKKYIEKQENLLETLDLSDRLKQRMGTLSKGQLQRTGFVQALMHDPEILFLDEPMSGLDPYWRYKILKFLSQLKQKQKTIIFSSHIISDVEALSDKIGLLVNGNLKWSGELSELQQSIKGYDIRCRTNDHNLLKSIAFNSSVSILPDGSCSFILDSDLKPSFIDLVKTGKIDLEYFSPLKEKTETLLFQFKD